MVKIIHTSGKRKRAVARATLKPGKGLIKINNYLLENYFDEINRLKIKEPIILAGDLAKNLDLDINVFGGGTNGQAEAVRLAVARALVQHNKKLEKIFLNYDRLLLIGDIRRKEARKPGTHSKSRAKTQKSYR